MQDFVARHSIDDLAERWRFSREVRMDERIGRRNEERYFPALQALTPLEEIGPIGQRWRPVDEEAVGLRKVVERSEEHTSELQSLMRISYAVFCLKKKKTYKKSSKR